MTQYPDAGRVVNTGELIELRISAGNMVVMVDLTGLSKDEAKELLETMGFTNVHFKEENSAAPVGTVISQSVEVGEDADINSKLMIKISSGLGDIDPTKDTTVPKFIGLKFDDAINKATEKKVYVVKGETKPSSEPAGTIISQDIRNGSTVKQGTTVTVVISSGEEKISVPYVEYLKEADAKSTLSAYSLGYTVSYEYNETVGEGLVISQSIDAGDKVKPGTKIKLVVSKGRTSNTVPNVSGMNESAAADKLLSGGFRYTVDYSHSESVGWGKVMSVYPTGKQEKGTKVTITVSCGTAGKLVSSSEYNSKYADSSKYSASKRYRYATREKEVKQDGHSTLSGWTKDNTKTTTTTTSSDWVFSKPKTESVYYEGYKETNSIVDSGYYYYCYAVQDPNKSSDKLFYAGRSRNDVINYMKGIKDYKNKPYLYDESKLRYFWTVSKTKGNYITHIDVNSVEDSTVGIGSVVRNGVVYSDLKIGLYYYAPAYKVKTVRITNYFWRWGAWSSWSDWTTKKSTSDSVKEDTEIRYYVVGKAPN